jgi:hypothetical protein
VRNSRLTLQLKITAYRKRPKDNVQRMDEENWMKRMRFCNLQCIKEKENEMLEREYLALSGIQVPNL